MSLNFDSLVYNNVSTKNGESSGMNTTNIVQSNITRKIPYSISSINFDGTADYIDCGDSSVFSFGNGTTDSPFSISTWVNMTTVANFVPIAKDTNGAREWTIRMVSGQIHFYVIDNSVADGYIGRKNSYSPAANTWFNLICTYDGSASASGIKIYLDGVRVDDADYVGTGTYVAMENTSAIVSIGMQQNGSVSQPGNISNTAIFNTALSQDDVLNMYNNGITQDLSSFRLTPISWWAMDQSYTYFNGSVLVARDVINGNDGTGVNLIQSNIIGNAPGSTANGTGTNLTIADLKGNMYNSNKNSHSVNMADYASGVTNPANSGRSTNTPS